MRSKTVAVFTISLFVFFFAASSVLAEGGRNPAEKSASPQMSLFGAARGGSESSEPSETPKAFRSKVDRLSDARLKYCETHQNEIRKRHESLGKLTAGMLGKFDAILARVQEFYASKAVPEGKVVPDYDTLTADIVAKKVAVQTSLANAQGDVEGFGCTADNPKGQIVQYREDMQLVKKNLQAYRLSIKNLITAVRTAVGEAENEK